jgi:predicted Fe-Mo cluster-binding NifX family protein
MKIILTAASPGIDSNLDSRFGRCAYLLLVDTETMEWNAYPNPGLSTSGGAGIKAAQFVADQGATAVLSGNFGPNAFNALQTAGISMYLYGDSPTVTQVLERFKNGQLMQVGKSILPERDESHHGRSL